MVSISLDLAREGSGNAQNGRAMGWNLLHFFFFFFFDSLPIWLGDFMIGQEEIINALASPSSLSL